MWTHILPRASNFFQAVEELEVSLMRVIRPSKTPVDKSSGAAELKEILNE
jgi:hypothetical protein